MSKSDNMLYRPFTNRERLRTILLFLFAFCVLAVSLTFFATSIGKPYMGISLSMDEHGWQVESVTTNGLANKAGIVEGDKPIEINSQPAQTFLEKYRKTGLVFGMLFRELTVIDDLGQAKSVALKDSSPSWQSVVEQSIWLVVCLISWITGFYVFFKRPRNIVAFLLCICGLAFGLALSANMAAEIAIPTALQFEIIASVIGPWVLFHFFLILPEERAWLHNNYLVYLIYLPAAITLVLFLLIGYADGQPVQWFRTVRLLVYGAGFLASMPTVET